jgi:hypothetical protein
MQRSIEELALTHNNRGVVCLKAAEDPDRIRSPLRKLIIHSSVEIRLEYL